MHDPSYTPRHRKHVLVKVAPIVQPAGRHAANRTRDRLGAESPDIKGLFDAAFGPNPYRGVR